MADNQDPEDLIWANELAFWDSVKTGDINRCATFWHNAALSWPNNQPRPLKKNGILSLMSTVLDDLQPGTADIQLTRLSVHVVGDVGIAYYRLTASAQPLTGTELKYDERLTHTWLRGDEGWKIVGGMAASIHRP